MNAPALATVFVTGANGRVGLPLIRSLVASGHSVVGLVRSEEKAAAVRAAGAEAAIGSLDDVDVMARHIVPATRIYHLAGGVRGPGRITPDIINNQGTRKLLEAIAKARPAALESLVFTSSVAVYGDRSSLWVEEDMRPSPNTRYGASKAAAETALLDAWKERELPVRIVRLGAVYGPGFPFTMAERLKAGKGWLPGEGRNFVSTIHIDDAVAGIRKICETGEPGGIYNLATPDPMPMADFYALVHEHVGGRKMRFWSTWVPSYVQLWAARNNERVQSRLGRRPLLTPDNIRLFKNSARMKVSRVAEELEMEWRYPDPKSGLAATFGAG